MYGGETQSREMLTDHSLVGKGEQEEIREKKVDLKTDDDDIEGVFCLSQQKLADGSPGVTPDRCACSGLAVLLCAQSGAHFPIVCCVSSSLRQFSSVFPDSPNRDRLPSRQAMVVMRAI